MLLEIIKQRTLLDESYIKKTCLNANGLYSSFYIPKKDGKLRKIFHPQKELKVFQRILLDNILSELKPHIASMAYSRGSSIRNNAAKHSNSKFLLRMDFQSFFESISSEDVFEFCETRLASYFSHWTKLDSEMFTNFVCYKKSLVMGAVTSPSIANLVLYDLDSDLDNYCTERNVTYTRYADDMYFSTDQRNVLKGIEKYVYQAVNKLELPKNLKININKTYHSSAARKRIVTGLVLTSKGHISLGRTRKRQVKSLIFNWENLGTEQRQSLAGYLSYAKSIEPSFINRLCMKYGADQIKKILEYTTDES